jgi:hypothetical protein
MIAQQLRQGNDNLMAEAPQGKQMGDVYVAPTWSENLAGAAQKMIGGYQMGQARKAGNQLGEDREETAQAVGLQKAMERKKAEQQQDVENQFKDRGLADKAEARAEAQAWREEQAKQRRANDAESLRRFEIQQAGRKSDDERSDKRLEKIEDKALQTETRQYSTALGKSGVPTLGTAINMLESKLEPFQIKDEDGNSTGEYENIPGIGGVSNTEVAGGLATAAGDLWTDMKGDPRDAGKPRGKDVRQSFQKVMNTVIVNEAGKAQTVQEALRQNRAAGFDIWADDKSFVSGISTIKDLMNAAGENVNRGFSQEARDTYANALPESGSVKVAGTDIELETPEKKVVRTGKTKDGRTVVEYEDGTREYR